MNSIKEQLNTVDLTYTNKSDLVITRKKWGKGFRYFIDEDPVTDDVLIKRITHLPIPPAWHNVRISKKPNSHIVAEGYDDKKRKQYLYHERWNEMRKIQKFNKMILFGEVLPVIRSKVAGDLRQKRLTRDKVIATVVWLLEHTFIRIGNENYARENETFGLTTLENRHVITDDEKVLFSFKGKSGVEHSVEINNPLVVDVIHTCHELPEQELFEYIDSNGDRKDISSSDINSYLKSLTGTQISAKDYRTWGGTVYAGTALYEKGEVTSKSQQKKLISTTVKQVAKHLRNTPSTARNYYIHPSIFITYEKGILVPHFKHVVSSHKETSSLNKHEQATWTLMRENQQA